MTLHAKNCVCRSNGVTVANTKTKRKKLWKKTLKGPKNVKNENFEKSSRRTYFQKIRLLGPKL